MPERPSICDCRCLPLPARASQLYTKVWEPRKRSAATPRKAGTAEALETVGALDIVLECLGVACTSSSFKPVCRCWFSAAVCHPISFRAPVSAWSSLACRELDEQLARMREPPKEDAVEDLRVGLDHAQEELRLTELVASFPSGVTVVLLRYTTRLGGLLHWFQKAHVTSIGSTTTQHCESFGAGSGFNHAALRRRYLQQELEELHNRVGLLLGAINDLRQRLPDPELPMRWAQWFEEAGELAGVPAGHCARYRSQREQVAAVWANNQRTFLTAYEHIDALLQCLDQLD